MSYETFPTTSENPKVTSAKDTECRTLSAGFGDGYRQETGDGLNAVNGSWPLEWLLPIAEVTTLEAFLEARAGFEPFWWTPPRASEAMLVRCKKWRRTFPKPFHDGLSATFVEAFEL